MAPLRYAAFSSEGLLAATAVLGADVATLAVADAAASNEELRLAAAAATAGGVIRKFRLSSDGRGVEMVLLVVRLAKRTGAAAAAARPSIISKEDCLLVVVVVEEFCDDIELARIFASISASLIPVLLLLALLL